MKKLILLVMLSGLLLAGFAQSNTTETSSTQPVKQEKTLKDVQPQCQLGDLAEHKVTREQILEQPYLKVVPEMEEPFKMGITSFRVIIVVTGGYEQAPILCEGNKLNEKVIEKISKLPAGSMVIFEDIRASSKAVIRNLDEVAYRIIEKE